MDLYNYSITVVLTALLKYLNLNFAFPCGYMYAIIFQGIVLYCVVFFCVFVLPNTGIAYTSSKFRGFLYSIPVTPTYSTDGNGCDVASLH